MQLLLKIVLSVAVILAATAAARRFPPLSGLIGVMPLAGALVFVWIYVENQGAAQVVEGYLKGALWGIIPSVLFYLAALFCIKKGLPLPVALGAGFGAWLMAALVHQWALR